MKMLKKLLFLIGFMILICLTSTFANAEDMHPIWNYHNISFFTRPHGELGFRFRDEFRKTNFSGGASGKSHYRFLSEEIRIEENMFILHPRFLRLNFGFGVAFDQGMADYESEGFFTDYKFGGQFLTGTPYSGSFFLEKQRNDYEHTSSSTYLMDMLRGGFNFRLGEEIIGWPINLGFKYESRESENMFNKFNSFFREERTTFEADTKKEWDKFKVNLRSRITRYDREFDSKGNDRKAELLSSYLYGSLHGKFLGGDLRTRTSMSVNSQKGFNEYLNLKFGQDINYWIIQNKLQTLEAFLKLNIERRDRDFKSIGGEDRDSNSIFFQKEEDLSEIRFGLSHQLGTSLQSEVEGTISKLSLSNYESLFSGIRAKTDYTKIIPWRGKLSGGYSTLFNKIKREGKNDSFITGESLILSEFSAISLRYDNVEPNSVRVFDPSGDRNYAEGVDYRVYQVGPKTYIERIPGTDIINGEAVFVDYKNKNPLGDITEFGNTISFGVSLLDGLVEPYSRFFVLNQETDGELGISEEFNDLFLNPGASWIFGFRSRNTFEKLWNLERESSIEVERNSQELYPFQRLTTKSSFSVQVPRVKGLRMALSCNKTSIDYTKSNNDYSLWSTIFNVGYDKRKTRINAGINYDSSSAGNTDRKVLSMYLGISKKIRKSTIDIFIRQALEEYETGSSATESDGLIIKFYISRKF